jgi:uncharacterized Zn finger protein
LATLPTITETDIRDFVGDRNFLLGLQYAHNGAVHDGRRQGMTLKARCQGSRSEAYRVEVTFDRDGIEDADCSCPVGYVCKHIAALLLVWLQQPEEFAEQQDVDTLLGQCSKPELIALIKRMLRRDPALEMMLETVGKQKGPINLESYHRKVMKAFEEGGREWGDIYEVVGELVDIKENADAFAEKQDYSSAVAIYGFIIQGVTEDYYRYQDQDQDGELTLFVNGCIETLERLLSQVTVSAELRERALRILFESGGIGLGEDAPDVILRQATAQERLIVAGWVRNELANKPSEDDEDDEYNNHVFGMSSWNREHLGGFLLELEADTLDDETYLRIARETGRIADIVTRLLDLGRVGEALAEADLTSDYSLFGMLPIFVQYEQGDRVEELVRKRLAHPQNVHNAVDTRLQTWLKQRYLDRHDLTSALQLSEQLFQANPTLPNYQEIRDLSSVLGQWDAKRYELLTFLEKNQQTQLLIHIALDEGEIDRALELLKTIKQPENRYGYSYMYYDSYTPLALEVAKAAEEKRPQAAIDIYRLVVERLIDMRGRGNYQTACSYLLRVRDLYEHLGRHDIWMNYVTNLRDKNRILRALKEEMQQAGLL